MAAGAAERAALQLLAALAEQAATEAEAEAEAERAKTGPPAVPPILPLAALLVLAALVTPASIAGRTHPCAI